MGFLFIFMSFIFLSFCLPVSPLLRQMRDTIEDIEDARTIERVKKAHGHKPRVPWSRVKQKLGLD